MFVKKKKDADADEEAEAEPAETAVVRGGAGASSAGSSLVKREEGAPASSAGDEDAESNISLGLTNEVGNAVVGFQCNGLCVFLQPDSYDSVLTAKQERSIKKMNKGFQHLMKRGNGQVRFYLISPVYILNSSSKVHLLQGNLIAPGVPQSASALLLEGGDAAAQSAGTGAFFINLIFVCNTPHFSSALTATSSSTASSDASSGLGLGLSLAAFQKVSRAEHQ
jgi:hypothetical protein